MKALLLARLPAGCVFLSEGIQKFLLRGVRWHDLLADCDPATNSRTGAPG